jgi:hypothetical protein
MLYRTKLTLVVLQQVSAKVGHYKGKREKFKLKIT